MKCDTVQFSRCVPMFHRNVPPLSSGYQMQAAGPSKSLVPICKATWHHIPEEYSLKVTSVNMCLRAFVPDMFLLYTCILLPILLELDKVTNVKYLIWASAALNHTPQGRRERRSYPLHVRSGGTELLYCCCGLHPRCRTHCHSLG